jgi:serine/threonine protein kinase
MSDSRNPIRFGKYVLHERIGLGGMAEVYRATLYQDSSVEVAIKKIPSSYSSDQGLVSLLIHEAKVDASLHHRNIVPVYDFGLIDGSYYLAMEFVRGKDLKSVIQQCRRKGIWINKEIAIYIVMEILEALSYAHRKRDTFNQLLEIVHRDISPPNIMVSTRGDIKVLDFGIAKIAGQASDTKTGALKGKFNYMSPEQARGERVDRRTDIFSVGVLLYEMLTLENPFRAETDLEILEEVKLAKPKKVSTLNASVPKELEKVLQKAMARRRQRRYQWPEELQQELAVIQRSFERQVEPKDLVGFLTHLYEGEPEEKRFYPSEEVAPAMVRPQYAFQKRDYILGKQMKKKGVQFWRGLAILFAIIVVVLTFLKFQRDSALVEERLLEPSQPKQSVPRQNQVKSLKESIQKQIVLAGDVGVRFRDQAEKFLDALSFDEFEKTRDALSDLLIHHALKLSRENRLIAKKEYRLKWKKREIFYRVTPTGEWIDIYRIN